MHEEQTLGDLWEGRRERGRSKRGGGEAEIRSEVGMGRRERERSIRGRSEERRRGGEEEMQRSGKNGGEGKRTQDGKT